MFAKLTALVGGGYSFPYNVEEAYPSAWGQWSHHRGTSKEDGTPVSVFKISATDANDRRLVIARNGVKRLRMLRHPNVLAFKDSSELQEKGQTVIYLVTQPVKPLKMVLDELNLSGQHRDEYLAMGILHMTNAVSFLNNDCKLIHGNICLDSVVVTETLDWKLHGFDLLSEHSLPADHCLVHTSWMVGNQYKSAELGRSEWQVIRDSPPWAVDAWGLGCLIQEVFSQETLASVDQLRRTTVIPPALLGDYQKLLSSNPSRRLNPSSVAESKFLNNRLVDVVAFMENIAVKDATDKDTFFKRLGSAVPSIPEAVAVRKILPQLSQALEFGGAPPSAVGPLLQIGNTLGSDDFNKRVVPTLSKLFASPDRTLRRSLLESIDNYAHHFSTPVLEEQIYVHLQSGFTDTNAYIRELTLKSVLSLAPKLSNKTLVNNVLKHLSKLQIDEEPSIRANTTVLLGNVSKYLGDATCKRVLINAFTRALKDAFPPTKIAGLRALVATQQYHSPEDVATRVIPAAAPLAVDGIQDVRQAALELLDAFTKFLKQADAQRQKELAAEGGNAVSGGMGNASSGNASSGIAGSAAPAIAAGSSMLNWAVSSLMTSTGLAVKPGHAAGGGAPAAADARSSVDSGRPTAPAPTQTASRPMSSSTSQVGVASTAKSTAASSTGGNGWGDGGDKDGWDDDALLGMDDDEEHKARARLSAITSTSRTTTNATHTSTAAAPGNAGIPRRSSALSAASSAKGSMDGWGDASEHADGWDALDAPAAPSAGSGSASGSGSSSAAAMAARRAVAAERAAARATSSGSGAAPKPKPGGAMKLGVQKLGVAKTAGSGLSDMKFDDDKW